MCIEGVERGMNSACINWRGLNHKLTTPKWYCNGSKHDFIEPIQHLVESLKPSKVYVIGVSLGGSVLSHALTEIKVDGAVIMNAPINFPKVMDHVKKGFGGYLNRAFGAEFIKTLLPHQSNEEIIKAFKIKHRLDLRKLISNLKKSPDTFYFHKKMIS
jgi:predicted alpha/beta-fold hydrolase